MKGRKPLPENVINLRGNAGHRPPNKGPNPAPVRPPCPRLLGPAGRRKWKELVPKLEKNGLLTELDGDALAGYCASYELWVTARKEIKEAGDKLIARSPNGYPMQHPYIGIANTALKQMHTFMLEFGLTPSARRRVDAVETHGPDDFERWLNGEAEEEGEQ